MKKAASIIFAFALLASSAQLVEKCWGFLTQQTTDLQRLTTRIKFVRRHNQAS